ncbi:MAG: ATP-binding protein [Rhodobacter sp.]|nr:ATP-binding protein [Rhodobacter sp.]MCA3521692.1 ATP-binding protein [Rhodobacter sp.]MCA3522648.1 ATP-binding protein [Rhodobacter sp.]MCA3528691.1 ATP-binding protein [Rhodobacter sp.]MCA3530341.1 ATP-binding protein [Rhodobacter sp.]
MNISEAATLIRSLSESRACEVKRWFDPSQPQGKAKLVKGLQAIRNYNGGTMVVGFDNTSLRPDLENSPADPRQSFHADQIQDIVSRYSVESFDVEVLYPELEGKAYVVIVVPAGVRIPVAVKRDLFEETDKGNNLLTCNDIYFRTLNANNTVSSAKVTHKDLPELMRICLNNQEADIGGFFRRHLGSIDRNIFQELVGFLSTPSPVDPTWEERLVALLDKGERHCLAALSGRGITPIPHGTFEVSLILDGQVPSQANITEFLRLLDASNPKLTGWPIWLDSSGFEKKNERPYVLDGGWEALIVDDPPSWMGTYIDFMRKEPSGSFYLRRSLQDDFKGKDGPTCGATLDFGLVILRTAEAIAVGMAFARALGCDPETTVLEFAFRWKGLRGRTLSSWANPSRYLSAGLISAQDVVMCRATVPLISAPEAIAGYTYSAVSSLFEVFEGFTLAKSVVEDLVARLLERRL